MLDSRLSNSKDTNNSMLADVLLFLLLRNSDGVISRHKGLTIGLHNIVLLLLAASMSITTAINSGMNKVAVLFMVG